MKRSLLIKSAMFALSVVILYLLVSVYKDSTDKWMSYYPNARTEAAAFAVRYKINVKVVDMGPSRYGTVYGIQIHDGPKKYPVVEVIDWQKETAKNLKPLGTQ